MLGDHTYTGLLQASNSEKKKELDLGDKFITFTSIKVTAPKKKNLQPSNQIFTFIQQHITVERKYNF